MIWAAGFHSAGIGIDEGDEARIALEIKIVLSSRTMVVIDESRLILDMFSDATLVGIVSLC